MNASQADLRWMARALELAARGQGSVEPNPMVGCVIVRDEQVVGEGWHGRFGGPHAEIEALSRAGAAARGATMYVTLEPCCHHGKTPPCCEAIIRAGIRRVVIAARDPFPQVDGGGIGALIGADLGVEIGVLEDRALELNAPYLKLLRTGRPWVIAKWAMTLDGKLATRTGESRWISNEASRAVVHRLRGRVDAVMIGRGTAERDDPLLMAQPPGPRTATRIVVDSRASLRLESQLVRTARDVPVLAAVGPDSPKENRKRLAQAGCEILVCDSACPAERLDRLLEALGARRMTNVLVEGGAALLGHLLDARAVDELYVFLAPKLVGGCEALSVGGAGIERLCDALLIRSPKVEPLGGDLLITGRIAR